MSPTSRQPSKTRPPILAVVFPAFGKAMNNLFPDVLQSQAELLGTRGRGRWFPLDDCAVFAFPSGEGDERVGADSAQSRIIAVVSFIAPELVKRTSSSCERRMREERDQRLKRRSIVGSSTPVQKGWSGSGSFELTERAPRLASHQEHPFSW